MGQGTHPGTPASGGGPLAIGAPHQPDAPYSPRSRRGDHQGEIGRAPNRHMRDDRSAAAPAVRRADPIERCAWRGLVMRELPGVLHGGLEAQNVFALVAPSTGPALRGSGTRSGCTGSSRSRSLRGRAGGCDAADSSGRTVRAVFVRRRLELGGHPSQFRAAPMLNPVPARLLPLGSPVVDSGGQPSTRPCLRAHLDLKRRLVGRGETQYGASYRG
jgi:hypothetical protein